MFGVHDLHLFPFPTHWSLFCVTIILRVESPTIHTTLGCHAGETPALELDVSTFECPGRAKECQGPKKASVMLPSGNQTGQWEIPYKWAIVGVKMGKSSVNGGL